MNSTSNAIGAARANPVSRRTPRPAWLDAPFRPMFVAAALWAATNIGIWLAVLFGGLQMPTRFNPLSWHIHEMLFGFVLAAVAGFLLTALAHWMEREPVRGTRLALLVGLWLCGRIATLTSAGLPPWLAIAADLAFPLDLLLLVAVEIIAARRWRHLTMLAPLLVFAVANLLMHFESVGLGVPVGLGWRLGLIATVQLISVIGGRIIPRFTREHLADRRGAHLPAPHGPTDVVAIGLLHAALMLWAVLPQSPACGAALLVAGVLNLLRQLRWQPLRVLAQPLLAALHIGYAWMAGGVMALGLSLLQFGVPVAAAIHFITVGAIGAMILAVMPRVSLVHTGRSLAAGGKAAAAMLILVNAAAVVRVAASWRTECFATLISVSGMLWITAFVLFHFAFGRRLIRHTAHNDG